MTVMTWGSDVLIVVHAPDEKEHPPPRARPGICCGAHGAGSDESGPPVTHPGSLWLGSVVCGPDAEKVGDHGQSTGRGVLGAGVRPSLPPAGCWGRRADSDGSQTRAEAPAAGRGCGEGRWGCGRGRAARGGAAREVERRHPRSSVGGDPRGLGATSSWKSTSPETRPGPSGAVSLGCCSLSRERGRRQSRSQCVAWGPPSSSPAHSALHGPGGGSREHLRVPGTVHGIAPRPPLGGVSHCSPAHTGTRSPRSAVTCPKL